MKLQRCYSDDHNDGFRSAFPGGPGVQTEARARQILADPEGVERDYRERLRQRWIEWGIRQHRSQTKAGEE